MQLTLSILDISISRAGADHPEPPPDPRG